MVKGSLLMDLAAYNSLLHVVESCVVCVFGIFPHYALRFTVMISMMMLL